MRVLQTLCNTELDKINLRNDATTRDELLIATYTSLSTEAKSRNLENVRRRLVKFAGYILELVCKLREPVGHERINCLVVCTSARFCFVRKLLRLSVRRPTISAKAFGTHNPIRN